MVNPILNIMAEKTELRKTGKKILLNDAKSLRIINKMLKIGLNKNSNREVIKTLKTIADDIEMVMDL